MNRFFSLAKLLKKSVEIETEIIIQHLLKQENKTKYEWVFVISLIPRKRKKKIG